MKKCIALFLVLSMAFSLTACKSKEEKELEEARNAAAAMAEAATQAQEDYDELIDDIAEYENAVDELNRVAVSEVPTTESVMESTEVPVEENADYWESANMVDEFGDATDESVILGLFYGSFSNTATMDAELKVYVNFVPNDQVFVFRLLEYGDHKATYLDSDEIILKTKAMTQTPIVDECTLYGTAPNGDLYLMRDKNGESYFGGNQLLNYFFWGYDVKCVIEIGSSKYSFTLEPDGFMDEFNEWKNG